MKTLSERCRDQIEGAILSGELRPNEKLGMERLKAWLGVGYSPIREALASLVSKGFVKLEGNRGFSVAPISAEELRDLVITFAEIEALAVGQAIAKGDEAWEAALVASLHRLSQAEKGALSYEIWAERNRAFHEALAAGCGSPTLMEIRSTLFRRLGRYIALTYRAHRGPLSLNFAEHEAIAKAALARDRQQTLSLLHHHLTDSLPC
ncbi:MAG: GntR family transcriptional regulator [Parachlamydiales bacterium]